MKWLLIIGIIIWILGGIIGAIAAGLVAVTEGRTSWEEAMPGIIGGGVCSCFGFVLAIIGLIMLLMNRSKAAAAK